MWWTLLGMLFFFKKKNTIFPCSTMQDRVEGGSRCSALPKNGITCFLYATHILFAIYPCSRIMYVALWPCFSIASSHPIGVISFLTLYVIVLSFSIVGALFDLHGVLSQRQLGWLYKTRQPYRWNNHAPIHASGDEWFLYYSIFWCIFNLSCFGNSFSSFLPFLHPLFHHFIIFTTRFFFHTLLAALSWKHLACL